MINPSQERQSNSQHDGDQAGEDNPVNDPFLEQLGQDIEDVLASMAGIETHEGNQGSEAVDSESPVAESGDTSTDKQPPAGVPLDHGSDPDDQPHPKG